MVMEAVFHPSLIFLSILVAIFASYVSLNLAASVTQMQGRNQGLWLAGGALAMGVGIWSMHFIGMLAFEMPGMAMAYDIPLMTVSILVAIAGSALALYTVSRAQVSGITTLSAGLAMATAISGMHYIGMYSMRMSALIEWNPYLVALSILIALVASFAALWILTRLRNKTDRIKELFFASVLMGAAIAGMHYVGMLAATFLHSEDQGISSQDLLVTDGLSTVVLSMTILILGLALTASIGQRIWTRRARKADEILGKSEENFRRLVEAVKDYAIFMLDPKGNITTWNTGAERISGFSASEVLGKSVSMFYLDIQNQGNLMRSELEAAKTTGHFETESQRLRKDGSVYWANVTIAPLYDQEDNLIGFSKVTRDITQILESQRILKQSNEELEERVRARTQALETQEKQLRAITDAVPVFLAQIDLEEKILFANAAFKDWFQLKDNQAIGTTFRKALGEERYSSNQNYVQRALQGEAVSYERTSHRGDQSLSLAVTLVPEFNRRQEVTGFIVVATNITKYKEIQEELGKAKDAAEVANATKSSFLANMSHEIRTPLGAVLGFSELLTDGRMNQSEKANCLEVIKRNGRLLSNIINDILDLSKVEAGKIEIERIEVPLSEVMKEIESVLNLEAVEKGIDFKVTTEEPIPRQIKTDPLRLRQILVNIVGNAIKFTKRGAISVSVKMISPAAQEPKLAFVVSDTGEGISPEQASRLFTPFTQADVSTTRKFGGTGLGLALSRRLANILGGDIVLTESRLGIGSTFTITIDPGIVGADAVTTANPISAEEAKQSRRVNLKNLHVLVVDDSLDNQALIQRILVRCGATVETANNGREAVEKALAGKHNVILMDLQMPVMDGYEATRLLRHQNYCKPIVALTAHAMKEERERTLKNGFDEHLTKPIDQQNLLRTLSGIQL